MYTFSVPYMSLFYDRKTVACPAYRSSAVVPATEAAGAIIMPTEPQEKGEKVTVCKLAQVSPVIKSILLFCDKAFFVRLQASAGLPLVVFSVFCKQ